MLCLMVLLVARASVWPFCIFGHFWLSIFLCCRALNASYVAHDMWAACACGASCPPARCPLFAPWARGCQFNSRDLAIERKDKGQSKNWANERAAAEQIESSRVLWERPSLDCSRGLVSRNSCGSCASCARRVFWVTCASLFLLRF